MSVTAKVMLASICHSACTISKVLPRMCHSCKSVALLMELELHPPLIWLVRPPAQILQLLEAGSCFPDLGWVPGSWEKGQECCFGPLIPSPPRAERKGGKRLEKRSLETFKAADQSSDMEWPSPSRRQIKMELLWWGA